MDVAMIFFIQILKQLLKHYFHNALQKHLKFLSQEGIMY